jgi:hypothetical protein
MIEKPDDPTYSRVVLVHIQLGKFEVRSLKLIEGDAILTLVKFSIRRQKGLLSKREI